MSVPNGSLATAAPQKSISRTQEDDKERRQSHPEPALQQDDFKSGLTRQKLHSMKSKAKRRVKEVVGAPLSPATSDDEMDEEEQALQTVANDPAFHPTDVERRLDINHSKTEGPIDRTKAALDQAATALAHPRKTVKNRIKRTAANKISMSAQAPPAAQKADVALLEYERELAKSRSSESRSSGAVTGSDSNSDDVELAKAKSKMLEQQGDSVRAAWITSRTRRVRVVPKEHIPFPEKADFDVKDEEGQVVRFSWARWLGQLLLYYTQDFSTQYVDDFEELPFDLDTLRNHVERLIIASGPWQTWLMDLRSIYRWENPRRTAKYLVVYVIFWYTSHLMAYFWAYILYRVIKNRYYPSSTDNLRAAARRAVNRETVAFQLGEMIDRHGREDWVDPLLKEAGPYAQVQVNDIANLLEVLYNFYSWKSPRKTIASLVFFAACLVTSLLADMEFCMNIVWFISGGAFFACWPIASLYPRYRLLVSPLKWVLWDIPTHAEWSFQYLRKQAQVTREAMVAKKVEEKYENEQKDPSLPEYSGRLERPHPSIHLDDQRSLAASPCNSSDSDSYASAASTTSILSGTDIISFRAHWNGLTGRLVIYPSGIRYVRSLSPKEMWRIPFLDLMEMWKVGSSKGKKLRVGGLHGKGSLCLRTIDEKVWTLEPVKGRDEAFNSIIGFSGLQWQSLQTEPAKLQEMMSGK